MRQKALGMPLVIEMHANYTQLDHIVKCNNILNIKIMERLHLIRSSLILLLAWKTLLADEIKMLFASILLYNINA